MNNAIDKNTDELLSLIDPIYNPKGKFVGNELKYVLQYLNSENSENDSNPWTARFEKTFAEKFGINYAIAHNSGTSTLHSCLHAAGIGAGDEVIVPAQTVICLAFSVIQQNAIPIFVDSDSAMFNMNPALIEKAITKKTKAIIAVHMHGLSSDMDSIMNIAKKYNLMVIEDCAQSMLSEYKGRLVGTIGHMASFSFETKKHMTTGQGGMVITNDPDLAQKVRKHAGLGYKTLGPEQGMTSLMPHQFQNPYFKRHDSLGYNYRLPEICAAIGLAQFERIDQLVERRIAIAEMYKEAIKGSEILIPQIIPEDYKHSHYTFAAKYYGQEKLNVSWVDFYYLFNKNGGDGFYGDLAVQYNEIVMQEKPFYGSYLPGDCKDYKSKFDYKEKLCPVAEDTQSRLMVFKTGYRDLELAQRVAGVLKKTIQEIESLSKVN